MKQLNQIFFKGLIVVLPITLTFYLLFWASVKIENMFGSSLKWALGHEFYFPGQGIIVTTFFILLVGLLVNNYLTGKIISWLGRTMEKVPLIKVIYNPLKDLMALIPGRNNENTRPKRVVRIPFGDNGIEALGLVTREELEEINEKNLVTVYVPFSYMLGGITVLVPKEKVKVVNMPVEQAIKLSVTAWIRASDKDRE